MSINIIRIATVVGGMSLASVASAHGGHGDSFLAGVAHPLFGLDHALAMIAVGLWAYRLGGRATWLVPSAFLVLMGAGGASAMAGMAGGSAETGITASVLLLGLLAAFLVRLPAWFAATVAGAFAVFHGYAHGLEMPAQHAQWSYVPGFLFGTAILHAAGMLFAASLRERSAMLRITGVSIAAVGGWLLTGAAL